MMIIFAVFARYQFTRSKGDMLEAVERSHEKVSPDRWLHTQFTHTPPVHCRYQPINWSTATNLYQFCTVYR